MTTNRCHGIPTKIVFLLEEKSAQELLNSLLPRILERKIPFQCIPHKGWGDPHANIPKKLDKWHNVRFVILHDQDKKDCARLKSRLLQMCAKKRRTDTIVCIACQELEAWYWGDLEAVAKAYPEFDPGKVENKERFRHPDKIVKPSKALHENLPEFEKFTAAQDIGPHMKLENNKSPSFQYFVAAVRKVARDMNSV